MKKYIIPTIVLVFILISIGVTVYLAKQRQETRSKAAPATVLSFELPSAPIKVGDEFNVNLKINTNDNKFINTAEIHIAYDQTVFQALNLEKGPVFSKTVITPTYGNGVGTIVLGYDTSGQSSFDGTGTLATLKLKALKATTTPSSLTYDSNTIVFANSENTTDTGNLISSMEPASVTVTSDAVVTSSPTPTLTQVPTVSTSPTPTPTGITNNSTTTTPTATSAPAANNPTSTPSPTPISYLPNTTTTPTVAVSSPANGQTISDNQPTISGKASPNASLIITIRSDPQTITTTADANGNWTIKPPQPLENGTHTLLVSATDANGNTTTKTVTFTVGLPETATPMPTIIMLVGGFFLLLFGLVKAL